MGRGGKAKKFGKEYRDFLIKGNVISLATGVVLGGAFQAIVNSLVNDIFLPVIGMITGNINFSQGFWDLTRAKDSNAYPYSTAADAIANGHVIVTYGALIAAIVNFLIIGLVIFLLVKGIASMGDVSKKIRRFGRAEIPEPPAPPTTKECPFCCSEISIKATRCPHCTSILPIEEEEPEAANV